MNVEWVVIDRDLPTKSYTSKQKVKAGRFAEQHISILPLDDGVVLTPSVVFGTTQKLAFGSDLDALAFVAEYET